METIFGGNYGLIFKYNVNNVCKITNKALCTKYSWFFLKLSVPWGTYDNWKLTFWSGIKKNQRDINNSNMLTVCVYMSVTSYLYSHIELAIVEG